MAIAHAQALRHRGSAAHARTDVRPPRHRRSELSPDGSRLVFTVSEPVKGTARAQALLAARHREQSSVASSPSPGRATLVRGGHWGSRSVPLRSGRPAAEYRLSMRGGEAEKLTDRKKPSARSAGRRTARASRCLMAEDRNPTHKQARECRQRRQPQRRQETIVARGSGHSTSRVGRSRRRRRAAGRSARSNGCPRAIASSPPRTRNPDPDQWNERIYATIDLKDGRFSEIAAPRGRSGAFALSPDGRHARVYQGARGRPGGARSLPAADRRRRRAKSDGADDRSADRAAALGRRPDADDPRLARLRELDCHRRRATARRRWSTGWTSIPSAFAPIVHRHAGLCRRDRDEGGGTVDQDAERGGARHHDGSTRNGHRSRSSRRSS